MPITTGANVMTPDSTATEDLKREGRSSPERSHFTTQSTAARKIRLESEGLGASIDAVAERKSFYDQRAGNRLAEGKRHYHRLLRNYFAFLVPPGQRVLELGCGVGDLLSSL